MIVLPVLEEKEVYQVAEEIAYINIKKTGGGGKSNIKEIKDAYSENEELLLKQIKEYNPNIIIFGGTLKYFNSDKLKDIGWGLEVDKKIVNESQITHIITLFQKKN